MRRILIGLALLLPLCAVMLGWIARAPATPHPQTIVADRTVAGPLPADADAPGEIAWEGVDLAEVRRALPTNRYWTDGAPTSDPSVKAERARAAEERNLVLGRILSGTATDDEIAGYYDAQQRLNEDYLALSSHVLGTYRGALSERDVGLLELAARMNAQRLAQLPDERLRAHARKIEQDRARAAWNEQHEPGGVP